MFQSVLLGLFFGAVGIYAISQGEVQGGVLALLLGLALIGAAVLLPILVDMGASKITPPPRSIGDPKNGNQK